WANSEYRNHIGGAKRMSRSPDAVTVRRPSGPFVPANGTAQLTRIAERNSKSKTSVSGNRFRTSNLLVYTAPRLAERSASRAFGTATHPCRSLSVRPGAVEVNVGFNAVRTMARSSFFANGFPR